MTIPTQGLTVRRTAARFSLAIVCALLLAGGLGVSAEDVADCTENDFRIAAESGDVTFSENCEITLTNGPVVIAINTTIDALGNEVIINGFSNRLFIVKSGATLTLEGLTLQEGVGTNGGAIYIEEGAAAVITDCTFFENSALGTNGTPGVPGAGGGLYGGNGTRGGPGDDGLGGAIYNLGDLTIEASRFFTNNAVGGFGGEGGEGGSGSFQRGSGGSGGNGGAAFGGAIFNRGTLSVLDTTFAGNAIAGGDGGNGGAVGGGVVLGGPGQGGFGGIAFGAAVYTVQTNFIEGDPDVPDDDIPIPAVIENCTFSDNAVFGGNSGSGSRRFNSSAPRGADGAGGGVANAGALAVTNSTFFQNDAFGGNGGDGGRGGSGGSGIGGGLYNLGTIEVVNCTVSDGSALGGTNGARTGFSLGTGKRGKGLGGNIANLAKKNLGAFFLQNSIVGTNFGGGGGYGAIIDVGHNLSMDKTVKLKSVTSLKRTNPRLGSLADNGGLTKTMALLSGSPAIDQIAYTNAPPFDQRDVPRGQGTNNLSDIGAFEATVLFIFDQPDNAQQTNGGSVTFHVGAAGLAPLKYDWFFSGFGATRATNQFINSPDFTIADVSPANEGNYFVVVSDGTAASVTSSVASLTVTANPPVITQLNPTNLLVGVGEPASFTVTATGDAPLIYRWKFGNNVVGTQPTYSIGSAQTNQSGTYSISVSNAFGVATANVTLTVSQMPFIKSQPVSTNVNVGETAVFSVTAAGEQPLFYQWRFNDTNDIPGATGPSYSVVNAQSTNAGTYSVAITNAFGSTLSDGAVLTVNTNPPPSPAFLRGAGKEAPADSVSPAVAAPSAPEIVPLGVTADSFTFAFPTRVGATYEVQYKDALNDPDWTPILTNSGTGDWVTNEISTGNPSRFFRVLVR